MIRALELLTFNLLSLPSLAALKTTFLNSILIDIESLHLYCNTPSPILGFSSMNNWVSKSTSILGLQTLCQTCLHSLIWEAVELLISKTAEKRRAPLFRSTTLELWASAAKSQLRSKLVSGNTCSKTSALLDQAYDVNASISFGVAHRNTTATKEILGTDRQLSYRGRLLSRKMILIWLSAARERFVRLPWIFAKRSNQRHLADFDVFFTEWKLWILGRRIGHWGILLRYFHYSLGLSTLETKLSHFHDFF